MQNEKVNPLFYVMLILSMVLWGLSWPVGKMLSALAEPELIVSSRLLLSFLSMIPLLFLFKAPFKVTKRELLFLVIGGFLLFIYNQLFFEGVRRGLAGAGGVLVTSLNPIFTYILWLILYRKRPAFTPVLGLVIGLVGGLILLKIWELTVDDLFQSGNIYFILGAFSWAVLTLNSQKVQSRLHIITYSLYIYGFAALFSFIPAGLKAPETLLQQSLEFWGLLVFMALGAISFSSTIYFFAAKKLGSHRAVAFIFTVPVTALLTSWLLVGERPAPSTIIGGLLAVTAVYFVNFRKESKK